jgi:hypothetical protein
MKKTEEIGVYEMEKSAVRYFKQATELRIGYDN